jgi:hypothetical protein
MDKTETLYINIYVYLYQYLADYDISAKKTLYLAVDDVITAITAIMKTLYYTL